MLNVKLGLRRVDLPCTLRIHGVTEEEFDALVDEDTKAELLDGEMIVHSPASPRHNSIVRFLIRLMSSYAEAKQLGGTFGPEDLVHLATCRTFSPDLFFLTKRRLPVPLPRKQFEGPPDLVLEVLSPSTRSDDLHDKRPAYQEAGVKEIWFVDPDREEIVQDRLRQHSYRTTSVTEGRAVSRVLKGFWVETAWLWAEPLPEEAACLQEIMR